MTIYNQNIKRISREKLISHAIQSLTKKRKKSFLVTKDHLTKITDHFNELLFRVLGNQNIEFNDAYNWIFNEKRNNWYTFYDNSCKSKKAEELKVLYLSGPEPYNDIEIFCDNGIRLENIWGIESNKKAYEKAIQSLNDANIQIKIHRGTLTEFFELTNHEFDIIYFDACSPLISPQQPPLEVLKQIFLNKRLTGLSALITNFAEPGSNYNWGEILAMWFATKDSMEVPSVDINFGMPAFEKSELIKSYSNYITQHLDSYYDTFLTHFISTIGSEIIPMWQLISLGSVQNNHLLNTKSLQDTLKNIREHKIQGKTAGDILKNIQHYVLAVESYPLLNWARFIRENISKDHALTRFINNNRNSITIEDALYVGTLLKRFEAADSGFKTFIYDICGNKLKDTLSNLDFFDRDLRLTCDTPMKNLLIELLIGLYGHPYIANASKSLSLKYRAKETWMYSNVFIFDQCRYLYDFLPTLDLWDRFFDKLPNQVIIRGCIDGISRNHFMLNRSLFEWGFIEDAYGKFGLAKLSKRINLNNAKS